MARPSLAMLRFAGCREPESLPSGFMCFLLGHVSLVDCSEQGIFFSSS